MAARWTRPWRILATATATGTLGAAGLWFLVVAAKSLAKGHTLDAAQLVAVPVAVVPLIAAVLTWNRRAARAPTRSTPRQVERARWELARLVRRQWDDEAAMRRLDDPEPLVVRWRPADPDLMDHPRYITGGGPLRFTGRTDRMAPLARAFRSLDRRRLVIVGGPGAGKTTLAVLLVRELLREPPPGEPVPVLLSLSSWRPGAPPLDRWLARKITETYPGLRAADFGPTAAASLVEDGHVLPVLDGLDELPPDVRPHVLDALNSTGWPPTRPLVLTCREDEYEQAVRAPGGDVVTGAAVIEPAPVGPSDAAAHLAGCLPPSPGGAWPRVLADLRDDPGGPLAKALTTPLALWLLRTVYVDTGTDPGVLRDLAAFPTAESITDHLLDELVGAAISLPASRDAAFRPRRSWNPGSARRWLTFLAAGLDRSTTTDLAWWRVPALLPRAGANVLAGAATFILIMGLVAVAVPTGLTPEDGLTGALVFALAVGAAYGRPTRAGAGLVAGLVAGLATAVAFPVAAAVLPRLDGRSLGPDGTLFIAVIAATSIGVGHGLGASTREGPVWVDLRLRGRRRHLARALFHSAAAMLILFSLLTIGKAAGSSSGTSSDFSSALLDPRALLHASLKAAWSPFLPVFAVLSGLWGWATTPGPTGTLRSPRSTLRGDLNMTLLLMGASAAVVVLSLWLGAHGGNDSAAYLELALGAFVIASLLTGTGVRYLFAVLYLGGRRRVPFRLMRFLEDAHRVGLLRQVGPVYQFRHAALQHRLAEHAERAAPR
ncbi:NACHT domain-containing protein [Actinomadura roseirufa]|uniref:NACHT domain-containing protein n=1 Tax=Actinomadura roseirufa TaxID=2094049 RepID=UPI0013F14F6E|nr:NACHT domain-containing protein [Actinomadura roseirufa]